MTDIAIQIIKAVCAVHGIDDIKTRTKKTGFTFARFIAIGLITNNTKLDYETIAAMIDRDRSSIYWANARYRKLIKKEHAAFLNNRRKVIEKLKEHGFKIH